jgi:hypothetical protein
VPQPTPRYFRHDGKSAAAEHLAFMDAAPEHATRLLAAMCELQNGGAPASIPAADDKATRVRGLYCRKLKGWALFYTADMPPRPFRIIVLHVARLAGAAFESLEAEAANRLHRLPIGD